MMDDDMQQHSRDYQRVARTIEFLARRVEEQPSLWDITEHVGVSEYHFQRMFTRWAGISPKRFLQFLTKEYAKSLLADHSVEAAALAAGLSTKSRLHDLLVTCDAMTPGEYRQQGAGLTIAWGVHPTPFGQCLIAVTSRGICKLSFLEGDEAAPAVAELQAEWALATLQQDEALTRRYIDDLFQPAAGRPPVPLLLKGTNFQLKVWEALISIPPGSLTTYENIARQVGSPQGMRAVGSAIGRNPVAFLIPCHRVIRKSGELSHYRWGVPRKQAMIAWESAACAGQDGSGDLP